MSVLRTPQFWLAELDQHGNPTLCDGSHDTRDGVEKAAYLLTRLGLKRDRSFACAEVTLTNVEAKTHGANEEAIATLNALRSSHDAPLNCPDGPSQAFSRWVEQGPKLALAAGVYVGIHVYASKADASP